MYHTFSVENHQVTINIFHNIATRELKITTYSKILFHVAKRKKATRKQIGLDAVRLPIRTF